MYFGLRVVLPGLPKRNPRLKLATLSALKFKLRLYSTAGNAAPIHGGSQLTQPQPTNEKREMENEYEALGARGFCTTRTTDNFRSFRDHSITNDEIVFGAE